jgi:mono/diheme cytochrome c family protein
MNRRGISAADLFTRSALGLVVGGALLLQTACHTARRGEPGAGPVATVDSKLERGRIAYMRYCNQCHPEGEGGLGPALNNKPLPKFMIKTQVRLGLGVMPDFVIQRLPPDQLDDLVDYLIALRRHGRH